MVHSHNECFTNPWSRCDENTIWNKPSFVKSIVLGEENDVSHVMVLWTSAENLHHREHTRSWRFGTGGKSGGEVMFIPVLAPQPDTLYKHCFHSTVSIKVTLKLSHISGCRKHWPIGSTVKMTRWRQPASGSNTAVSWRIKSENLYNSNRKLHFKRFPFHTASLPISPSWRIQANFVSALAPVGCISSSDCKKKPNGFHTERRHRHTCRGHPAFLPTTGHLMTQKWGWALLSWRGREKGGGAHTSHRCHQNHRLSEGAGEVMSESFLTKALLEFAKK